MTNKSRYYLEWFKKAEEDELSAAVIVAEGGAPSTACFLAHQMAEKYLKGFLEFTGKSPDKVHDLMALEVRVAKKLPKAKELHDDLYIVQSVLHRDSLSGRLPRIFHGRSRRGACGRAEG